MANELKVSITMITTKLKAGLAASQGLLKRFGRSVCNAGNTFRTVFRRMRSSLIALGVAAAALAITLKKSFEFEKYRTQFKVLLGSMEAAQKRMKELSDFSARTPFQIADIAKASKVLEVLTDGLMGGTESLRVIGDAASFTGAEFDELAMWVGRAYSGIASGRPVGRAAQRLQQLGILSGEARNQLEELQKANAPLIEQWAVIENALDRFSGGMAELSKTGEGLFSTLKDNWTLALVDFGDSFLDVAKGGLQTLIDKIRELRSQGIITEWADKTVSALDRIVKIATSVTDWFGKIKTATEDLATWVGGTWAGVDPKQQMKDAAKALLTKGPFGAAAVMLGGFDPSAGDQALADLNEERAKEDDAQKKKREDAADEFILDQMEAEMDAALEAEEYRASLRAKLAEDQTAAEIKARKEAADAFSKQEEELINKIAGLEDKRREETQKEKLKDIEDQLRKAREMESQLAGDAAMSIEEMMAKQREQKTEQEKRDAELKRIRMLEERSQTRGLTLTKKDQAFLDAARRREEIDAQRQVAEMERKHLEWAAGEMRRRIAAAAETTATKITNLEGQLADLLKLK